MTPKPFLSAKDMGIQDGHWYVPILQETKLTRDDFVFIEDVFVNNKTYLNSFNKPVELTIKDYRRATTEDLRALIRNLYVNSDTNTSVKHIPIDSLTGGTLSEIVIPQCDVRITEDSLPDIEGIVRYQGWISSITGSGYVYHKGNFAEIIDEPTSNIIVDVEVAPSGNSIVKVNDGLGGEQFDVNLFFDDATESPITEVEFEDESEVEVTEQYWWYLGNPNTIMLIDDTESHTLSEARANGYVQLHCQDIQTYCKLVYTKGVVIQEDGRMLELTEKTAKQCSFINDRTFYNKTEGYGVFSSAMTNGNKGFVLKGYFFNDGEFSPVFDADGNLDYKVLPPSAFSMDINQFSSIRNDKFIETIKPVDTAIFCKDDSEFIIPEVVIKPTEVSNKPMRFCIDED